MLIGAAAAGNDRGRDPRGRHPETAKKLKAQGHTVRVQAGAGVAASATDEAYAAAGAEIVDRAGAFGCGLVLKVRSPFDDELTMMKPGATLVGMLNPFDAEGLKRLAEAGLTSFALEAAPRTTRAREHGRAVLAGQHRRLQGRDDWPADTLPAPVPACS
jgi:NAD/NADP transhydrogenase alpha subunit